ncbi:MAG: glycosyltransferase family 2 protein [Bacilli bacterium]|nr:glycosyltransferase family 2 protein [Bacilli bacterium]
MNERIDVLIPVYNGAKYISACINSIINQTYKNLNIIVLDDGSKDESLDIIKNLALKDERIKVYSKPNEKKVSIARNFLLDKIESKYFIFVDADDIVSKYYIENLMNAIIKTSAQMACCEYTVFKCMLSKSNKLKRLKTYNSNDAIGEFVLGGRGHFMLWNKLIESSLIKNINFNNDINYGEDMFFVLDVLHKNDIKVASIANWLYYYKIFNLKSISKGGLNENKKLFLETLIKYEKEERYLSNTRIISTWIYLTATYYQVLAKKDKEYKKYLKKIKKERKNSVKDELEHFVVMGRP